MMLAMVSGKAKKRKPLGFIVIVFIVILPTFSLCYNIIVCFLSLSHSLTISDGVFCLGNGVDYLAMTVTVT